MLILAFRTNVHLVNYNAFRKISHVRPLYPVAPETSSNTGFFEFAHNRTFFVKHIKTAFVMKYLHNLSVRDMNIYTLDASLGSRDISSLILTQTENAFPQINITVKQVIVKVSTQSNAYHPIILLSNRLKSRTVVFLRNSVAPDASCNLIHFIGGSPSRMFHVQLHSWTIAWFPGYLDFGNLGLLNLDCLA